MTRIAVVFHSNGEHTTQLAHAVEGDYATPRYRDAATTAAQRAAAATPVTAA